MTLDAHQTKHRLQQQLRRHLLRCRCLRSNASSRFQRSRMFTSPSKSVFISKAFERNWATFRKPGSKSFSATTWRAWITSPRFHTSVARWTMITGRDLLTPVTSSLKKCSSTCPSCPSSIRMIRFILFARKSLRVYWRCHSIEVAVLRLKSCYIITTLFVGQKSTRKSHFHSFLTQIHFFGRNWSCLNRFN